MTELPTLRVLGPDLDTGLWSVTATSYNMTMPSGLGTFNTEAEAIAAMNALADKIAAQGKRKQPTKKQVRMEGAD